MTVLGLFARHRRPRPALGWVVPVVALGALGPIAAPAAAASPPEPQARTVSDPVPAGFASWDQLFSLQTSMNATVRQVRRLAGLEKVSGYAGAVASPTARRVEIFWNGKVPEPVRDFAARSKIPVDIKAAPYSKVELEAAAKVVTDQMGRSTGTGRITEVSAAPNGTGLQVQVAGAPRVAGMKLAAGPVARPAILSKVKVPVDVEVVADAPQSLSGRWDTQSHAGAYMRNMAGPFGAGSCSTAFSIGDGKAFTARHCFPAPDTRKTVYSGTGGRFADLASGPVTSGSTTMDAAVIESGNPNFFEPTMWRGASASFRDGSGQTVWQVTDWAMAETGNIVSTSGAASGELRNIEVGRKVLQYEAKDAAGNDVRFGPAWKAKQVNGTAAAGRGDSGGPVFTPDLRRGGVTALGIISAGDVPVACPEANPNGRFCGSTLRFVDIQDASAALRQPIMLRAEDGRVRFEMRSPIDSPASQLPTSGEHNDLMSANNGYEADLEGGNTTAGTEVQAARGEAENPNNDWIFRDKGNGMWEIETAHGGGMVIDHNPDTHRTHLVHSQANNTNQLWSFQGVGDGWNQLQNGSGGCLTADKEGDGLGVWACDANNDGQKWRVG
ncbi:trypsin-like serine protease [Streptomyces sp. cg36]|uniref:trypsin-like serine protease n=1 Tax=Streptomyces sp. cg36 TaxID=3238798 RepID=UPI0034E1C445